MSNADDGTFGEFLSDDPLDSCIRLRINGSGGLVHEQDPATFQNDTPEAEKLLLSNAPVLPHVSNYKEEATSKDSVVIVVVTKENE